MGDDNFDEIGGLTEDILDEKYENSVKSDFENEPNEYDFISYDPVLLSDEELKKLDRESKLKKYWDDILPEEIFFFEIYKEHTQLYKKGIAKIFPYIRMMRFVEDAWDSGENGFWVILKEGYFSQKTGSNMIHEFSYSKLEENIRSIVRVDRLELYAVPTSEKEITKRDTARLNWETEERLPINKSIMRYNLEREFKNKKI